LIHIKTILFSTFALALFTACNGEPEQNKTDKSVINHKVNAINEAKKSVEAINTKNAQNTVEVATQTESTSGSSLYSLKCASCHGKDARKSALNASEIIAGWSAQKTQNALNGYKNGKFGGKMKAIMEGQSKPLSDSEIKLISDYIAIL